jgi:phosphohistidine phosphatase
MTRDKFASLWPKMKILIVRHARAGDKAAFAKTGKPDSERPLTKEGARRFRGAARGLRRVAPGVDRIISSPFVRARQTAGLLAKTFPRARRLELRALSPDGDYAALAARLPRAGTAAVVGHEPHLSGFVDWLAADGRGLRLELKKGGACLIETAGKPAKGGGMLLWSLPPRLLRKLA